MYRTVISIPVFLGRTLTPDDDVAGGNPAGLAVVISEHFWRSWFGGEQDVVGRKLQIDNTMFTVAGVMPKSFIGADPAQLPEIFVPLAAEPILEGARSMTAVGHHGWWLTVMGRLQPGVTVEQANAALLPISMPRRRMWPTPSANSRLAGISRKCSAPVCRSKNSPCFRIE